MTNKEFYQETFSQLRSSCDIQWEDMEMRTSKRHISRHLVTLAAVIALMAVLSAAAVAADLFGLRRMLLPQWGQTLSLSGYAESPESRALAQWRTWLAEQGLGAAAEDGGTDPWFQIDQIYTPEMEEALTEIAEKYGLTLHPAAVDAAAFPGVFDETFLGENNRAYHVRICEDGTFFFDGEYDLSGGETLSYQFIRCVRGSFTDGLLEVGDVSRYQEWTYETACGRTVTAALAEDRGVLIADLEDCLVTVNVPRAELERQDLEALADSIDFGRLTPVTAPDLSGRGADTQLNTGSGLETGAIRTFAAELLDLLERDDRAAVAERFSYPCTVTTAEGETFQADTAQELLDRWDEAVAPMTGTLSEALMGGDFFSHDGLVGTADGAVWFGLTGDGQIHIFTLQTPEGAGVRPVSPGISAGPSPAPEA